MLPAEAEPGRIARGGRRLEHRRNRFAKQLSTVNNGFLQRGGWWVVGQGALMLAVAVLGVAYHGKPNHPGLFWGGVLLLAASAACGLAGFAVLGRNLTPFPRPHAKTELVQSGIYRLVRHPLYVAVTGASVGWALVWHSWPALAAALILAPFFDAKARREELWLRQQFPGYADYDRKVRRFIPYVY